MNAVYRITQPAAADYNMGAGKGDITDIDTEGNP